jgi:hypothetical protein
VEASGQIRVADALQQAVLRVDPSSGARTLLVGAGGGCGFFMAQGIIASGFIPRGIALEADGQVLVTATQVRRFPMPGEPFPVFLGFNAIVRVDPVSGHRVIVSSETMGRGPGFQSPVSMAVERTGQVLIADERLRAILRVDARRGDRALIAR